MKTRHMKSWATLVAVVLVGQAHATTVITYGLVGTKGPEGGPVVLGEFSNGPDETGYAVDVAPGVNLNAFAVSFVTPLDSTVFGITVPSGWSHVEVPKAEWSKGLYGFAQVEGSTLGSFESLFGLVDDTVIVFTAPNIGSRAGFMTDTSDSDITDWGGFGFVPPFIRTGLPSTEFIALGGSGNIIGGSLIPEPSSALLGLLGCLGLLRRKR